MTIVIETYTNSRNEIAHIEQEKYSNLFRLSILKPYNNGSQHAELLFQRDYTSKETAKRALKRFSKDFRLAMPGHDLK